VELARGIEPPTCGLQNRCSAIELRQLFHCRYLVLDTYYPAYQAGHLPPYPSSVISVSCLRYFTNLFAVCVRSALFTWWYLFQFSAWSFRHSVADHESEIQTPLRLPLSPSIPCESLAAVSSLQEDLPRGQAADLHKSLQGLWNIEGC
jgi:hypothetical protein